MAARKPKASPKRKPASTADKAPAETPTDPQPATTEVTRDPR